MGLKTLRKKLELVEIQESDASGMAFHSDGKYYTDSSYRQEVDKAYIEKHDLTVIRFGK